MSSLILLWLAPASAVDLAVGAGQPYATLEVALDVAVSGDRILVDPGLYSEGQLAVSGLVLEVRASAGPGTVVIEADGGNSLFNVSSGAQLTLVDLEVDGDGRRRLAEVSASTLVVEGCTVHDVEVPTNGRSGGAIDATDSTVSIRLSSFTAGSSPIKPGGFLALDSSDAEIFGTSFEGGSSRSGGAISAEDGSTLRVESCTFVGNDASSEGGAIDAVRSDLEIFTSVFTSNDAGNGTVRCSLGATCRIEDSWFEANTATNGSAVLVDGSADTWLLGTMVCQGTGLNAVDLRSTAARVQGSIFLLNAGRGLRVDPAASAEATNNHFVANTSVATGAAMLVEGQATLTNSLFAYNDAGGAVVAAAGGALTSDYDLYYENLTADLDVAGGAGDVVGLDPLLVVPTGCEVDPLRVGPGSPAVDAGDPGLQDLDGTRSDIGAFGGQVPAPTGEPTDEDGDGWTVPADCNDADPDIHPGAAEIACNDVDDDCQASTPDAVDADGDGTSVCDGDCLDTDPERTDIVTVYKDSDYDGFGVGEPVEVCGMPLNASEVPGDCDDRDASVYPGAVEIPYDGIDQDCDGIDPHDLDGDGFDPPEDCDDADPDRYPGHGEVPGDGIDQDCTGFDADATLTGGAGLQCGCGSTSGASPGLLGLALLLGLSRRRT